MSTARALCKACDTTNPVDLTLWLDNQTAWYSFTCQTCKEPDMRPLPTIYIPRLAPHFTVVTL